MREMPLVANRFVRLPNASVVDLATGDRVVLTIATAGGASEQTRWAVRCDTLRGWRHPSIARLIDFGAVGDGQRFEAWHCGSPWSGQSDVAEQVRGAATRFLASCGLSTGDLALAAMRGSPRGPVLLPSAEAGYREANDRPGEIRSLDACAIANLDRPAVAAIAELFETPAECRPRLVSLCGPPGAGKSTAIGELARAARLKGLVPIAIDLLASPLTAGLDGRVLFIINDERRDEDWEALVHCVLQSPRAHVLVRTGLEERSSASGVALNSLSVEALVSSVRPAGLAPALLDRVRRAAERANGQPGRFAALLWGLADHGRALDRVCSTDRRAVRAAEQATVYGEDESCGVVEPATAQVDTWPAPGEMVSLRRRMDAAVRLLATGRHAPGDRALRQAIGGLVRRADWTHAANGAKALAASLLKRGRALDARAALDDARKYCERSGSEEALLDVATIAGHAWLDLGRLDEAESVLGAAVEAAKARADGVQLAEASLAMARCLFWRGRYAEADAALAELPPHLPDPTMVRIAIAASRHAVGRREPGRAVSAAADAGQRAEALRDPGLRAAASYAAAFAHLAVSDLDAVDRDVAACLASTRAARDPLRAIRARLLLAEAERRRHRRAVAASTLGRFARLDAAALPPIVGARCHFLRDLLKPDGSIHDIVERHTKTTGLMALRLLTPDGSSFEQGAVAGLDAVVDGLVGILHVCQNADEETAVLGDVCVRLRRQLHAAAVAFVGVETPDSAAAAVIAADGGRIEPWIARRAMDAGISISPHRVDDRVEAAAPVRYGGATIAALSARWTLGTTHTLSGAATVLTMAAAAAAPAVAAAIARRRAPASPGPTELLGVSAAMADVRRAVERAAAAPFCVLIEGESGCGKELVARAVHRCSPRRDRTFCTLNCAALPDDLVESELFGHARGAFTGAVSERPGVFEEAHTGTLFLDEIGELSLRAQAKVLRVIQEGELRRVGENIARRVDVRILSATNRDLRKEVAAGRFRLDLLYRLDVLRIAIPPLRDRREDVAELVERFWRDAARRIGSHATLAAATVAALARYDWPGNVRELQNVLAALAVRTPKRGVIAPTALPPQFGNHRAGETWKLDEARRTFEAGFVRAALVRTGGHRAQAATELGVTRQGLTKLMSRLGIAEGPASAAPGPVRPTTDDQR